MLTYEEIRQIASKIEYKEEWKLTVGLPEHDNIKMWWTFKAPCVKTGEFGEVNSRKWGVSRWSTESEVVQTALMAALAAEEHEAREAFQYKGKRVFNPHIDVNVLLEVCNVEDVRDGLPVKSPEELVLAVEAMTEKLKAIRFP